jgi:putative copper export protein
MYFALVWLHLLAAVVWIGGMLFLSLVLAPVMRSGAAGPEWPAMFRTAALRFRRVVYGSMVLLLSTGPLLVTERGVSLVSPAGWPPALRLKLALVLVMLILTAVHDLVLGPQMRSLAAKSELMRTSWEGALTIVSAWLPRVSVLFALAVLAAAAVLARS